MRTTLYHRFVMVGCGKMGMALLTRWVECGVAEQFIVIEPDAKRHAEIEALGRTVTCAPTYESQPLESCDAILFAVKPQMAHSVIAKYKEVVGDAVLLSVMAGLECAALEAMIEKPAKVIRVMPNTPAMIGEGVSVCCGNDAIEPHDKERALALFDVAGDAHWLADESLMHAVTGLSGSGPAYVFHMIEAMTHAGMAAGLDETLAQQLAVGTVRGAGALAAQSDDSPETLRENVTSPHGTTQAGLDVLMHNNALSMLLENVIASAARRSKQLSE